MLKKLLPSILLLTSLLPPAATGQVTWEQSLQVAASSFGNNHPRVVINRAGNPVIVWGRSSDASVFSAVWDGQKFSAPVKLNGQLTVATASWMGPDVASHGDTIYAVMKQTPEDNPDSHLWMVRSEDGGKSFSSPSRIENIADSISRFPTVCTDDDGHPVVAFMKFGPGFKDSRWAVCRSDDYGQTFGKDVKASGWGNSSSVCDCCPGSVIFRDNVCVVLYRDNNRNIRDSWASFSYDGGRTFTAGINVDNNRWNLSNCPASGPDGVMADGQLISTFMNGASGKYLDYWSRSDLQPARFQKSTLLPASSGNIASQNFPRIDAFGKAVAIAWREDILSGNQFLMQFTPDVSTTGFKTDTVDLKDITAVDVAVSGDRIYFVWQDDNSRSVRFRAARYSTLTSVAEIETDAEPEIIPNPVYNSFAVRAPEYPSLMQVRDMTGRTVHQQTLLQQEIISSAAWPAGHYIVSFYSKGSVRTKSLIRMF